MNMRRWSFAVWVGVLPLALGAPGCLKRAEKINITSDGAVTIAIEYEGEKGDFETLDALPSEQSGWKVSRETHVKEDKKEEVRLTSERKFAPREDLPSTFAAASDPNAGLALSFPTTLQWERRSDGVVLHFRRVYKPREWAYVDFWSAAYLDDNVKKLAEKKPEELSQEERVRIIKAFAGFESMKQVEFAQRAIKEADESIKPDHALLARAALLEVYENDTNWEELAERFGTLPAEERDQQLEKEVKRIEDQGHRAFVQSLRTNAKYDDERMAKLESAFERAKRSYEITNQLAGHNFQIRVGMPGTVVAHNGDKVDDGEVVWEFDGKAFRDRPYELMVTSRLPLGREDRE